MIFSWNDGNTEHIAKHGVTPREAEQVVEGAVDPFPRATRNNRRLVWGPTKRGRLLQVIFEELADEEVDPFSVDLALLDAEDAVVRVVHARDLTDKDKKHYRRLKI